VATEFPLFIPQHAFIPHSSPLIPASAPRSRILAKNPRPYPYPIFGPSLAAIFKQKNFATRVTLAPLARRRRRGPRVRLWLAETGQDL